MRKIVLCPQYWEGDREATYRNLRRIADNEPAFREDTEIMLCARFDCQHDPETVKYISTKFKVHLFTSPRRGTGWPSGCNDLAFATMHEAANRFHEKEWNYVKAIFLMESDCIPIAKDWLDVLHAEWDEAESLGKQVAGCWMEYHGGEFGHINGNLLIHPYLVRARQIIGCSPIVGWDDWIAPFIQDVWHKAGFIKNLYRAANVAESDIVSEWIPGKRPVLIHGVKDLSVENYADRILFSDVLPKATDT